MFPVDHVDVTGNQISGQVDALASGLQDYRFQLDSSLAQAYESTNCKTGLKVPTAPSEPGGIMLRRVRPQRTVKMIIYIGLHTSVL